MENVVVLFGFSGADPNFRAWHGWVRDHLGNNIQPIYLVTLRPTDPIDVNLMAGRLINQIDLSQKREWQHLSANAKIEKFLTAIHRRLRSLRVNLDWPSNRRGPADDDPSTKPANNHLDWRLRLNAYPRWLVAPARNRSDLLLALDEALDLTFDKNIERGVFAKLLDNSDARPSRIKTDPLTERESTALVVAESLRIALARPESTLFGCLKNTLITALNDLLAQPGANASDDFATLRRRVIEIAGEYEPKETEAARARRIIMDKLGEQAFTGDRSVGLDVVLRLLPLTEIVEREARLRTDNETAQTLRDVLWLVGGEGPGRELAVRGALALALTDLQIREIAALLDLWPEQPHDAASNLRRAATLREIGWIRESYHEVSSTVDRLRSLDSARRRGVAEASREAWAFYLYADLLEGNKEKLLTIIAPHQGNLSLDEVIVELHERLDELETNRCDPRREIDRLARDLDVVTAIRRLAGTTRQQSGLRPVFEYVVSDPASTFVILSETVGVAANHSYGGSRLALTAARLLVRTHRQLAIGLLLRAGTPEDLRFAGVDGGTLGNNRDTDIIRLTKDEDWRVADIVFDKAHSEDDFQTLAKILDSLVAPPPVRKDNLVDPPYLDRKIRLLQHLIAGLIAREGAAAPAAMIANGFDLACRIARSPVVAATRAGWANQSLLFEATLANVPTIRVKLVLAELFGLPIPSDADDTLVAAWPDPFRLLVEAWYPEDAPSAPGTELRVLGARIVAGARRALATNPQLRSALVEIRRNLKSMKTADHSQHRLIVARRLTFLDAALTR
jgi:hypothetical protein